MQITIKKIFLVAGFMFLALTSGAAHAQNAAAGDDRSTVIADVGIYGAGFATQNKRDVTLGFTLRSDLGTQAGVHYGVNVYTTTTGTRTLSDTFASNDSVTLKQGVLTYREITYQAPANISGDVELALVAKTDTGLPLSEIMVGKYTFEKAANVPAVSVESCDLSQFNVGLASCVVKNSGNASADVLFYSELRNQNQFGTLLASPYSAALTLKSKESTTVKLAALTAAPGAGMYSFETRIMAKDNSLVGRKVFTTTVAGSVAKISNVFVGQNGNNFTVGVVSISHQAGAVITVRLEKAGKLCDESKGVFSYPRTDVSLQTNVRSCAPDTISAELISAAGASLDKKIVPYSTVMPEAAPMSTGNKTLIYGFGGAIGLLIAYAILTKKREDVVM